MQQPSSILTASELLGAAHRGDLQTLRYAVEVLNDEIFDVSDEDGLSLLHAACIGGQLPAVQLLLYEAPACDDALKACNRSPACRFVSTSVAHTPGNACSHLAQTSGKSDNTDNSSDAADDSGHTLYTSTESAPHTVSSRVSTRSSDTSPCVPATTKMWCPSCLVTRLECDSENCLKCGDALVELDVTVFTLQSTQPSFWASKLSAKGHNALHWAALKGHSNIVKELLFSGFNVNAVTNQNATALQLAAARGNVECVKLLTRFKADINIKTNSGSTPMSAAKSLGFATLVELLEPLESSATVDVL